MNRSILTAVAALALVSCSKAYEAQAPQNGGLVTIHAVLPEESTVRGASPKKGISWTWSAEDRLTVKGSTAQVFTIKDDFTPKQAGFTGIPVEGESYSIYYPSDEIESSVLDYQLQNGNGSMGHLVYQACLSDIDTYATFAFSNDWAVAHGGTLRQTGVLELDLTLPEAVTKVNRIALSSSEPVFFAGNGEARTDSLKLTMMNTTVGSDHLLTAGLTTSWHEAQVVAGTVLTVTVVTPSKTYKRNFVTKKDASILPGALNTITLDGADWIEAGEGSGNYYAGKGTKESPWIITNSEHMLRMQEDLVADATRYYRLGADVDMGGVAWKPLNADTPYAKKVDFDGAGHTVSRLGASFFKVLNGSVYNLVLDRAAVNGGAAATGILACQVETDGCSVNNVDITNSSVSSTSNTGVLIGQINKAMIVTDCDVVKTNASGSLAGGVIGYANALVNISGCTYTNGTVTANTRYAGGLLGSTYNVASVISDCHVNLATVTSTAAANTDDRVGGFIGQLQTSVSVTGCSAENVNVTGGKNTGGFVGVCYGTVTDCIASGSVHSTGTDTGKEINIGGFVGYLTNTITRCTSSCSVGDVTGRNIGGLAGVMIAPSPNIIECRASGSVRYRGYYAGGLVGRINLGSIQRSIASGDVFPISSGTNSGGLVGWIAGTSNTMTISDCISTGKIGNSGQQRSGGLVGLCESGKACTISNCYATGEIVGSISLGGLVARISDNLLTVKNCAAWNSAVTAGAYGSTNWSSGAVVGVSHPNCKLINNYRNPNMSIKAWWIPDNGYNHPDVEGTTHPLVRRSNSEPYTYEETTATAISDTEGEANRWAFHGRVNTDLTLSELASGVLGWSDEIWDFSEDLPKLK